MALEREWKLDASSRRCQACSRAFAVGDEYYSAVVETTEENRLARQEFCPACWKPDGGAYFSFWKARVPPPEEHERRGPRLVDLGRLMQLFEHLADSTDEPAQRFRYVLALVLMRKRRLKIVESRRLVGGRGEELTLRETGTERRFVLSSPSVTEEEIRSVADRLREILDMPETWDQVQAGETEVAEPSAPEIVEPAAGAAGDAGESSDPDSGGAEPAEGGEPRA